MEQIRYMNLKSIQKVNCLLASAIMGVILIICMFGACTAADRKNAINTVLDVQQFACVLAMQIEDEAVVADVCHIADQYRPLIREILAGKSAAKQVQMYSKLDAGMSDASYTGTSHVPLKDAKADSE